MNEEEKLKKRVVKEDEEYTHPSLDTIKKLKEYAMDKKYRKTR